MTKLLIWLWKRGFYDGIELPIGDAKVIAGPETIKIERKAWLGSKVK